VVWNLGVNVANVIECSDSGYGVVIETGSGKRMYDTGCSIDYPLSMRRREHAHFVHEEAYQHSYEACILYIHVYSTRKYTVLLRSLQSRTPNAV
jgi:hypothetical protein